MMWWQRIAELLPPEKRGEAEGEGAGSCSQRAEGFLKVFSKFLQTLVFVST
jgi:hypothetical protein